MTDKQQQTADIPREGQPERSGGRPSRGSAPDPEVASRATRRRFTAKYKASILREAERCRESGSLGAMLRREGLYSSHLANWRKQEAAQGRAAQGGGDPRHRCRPFRPPGRRPGVH